MRLSNSSLELAAWPEYVTDIMTISTVEGSLRRWGEAAYIPGHRWSWSEELGSGRTECSKGSRLVTSSSASPANHKCLSFKQCKLHLVQLTRMSVSCTLDNKSGPPLLFSSCAGATVSCRGWQCAPLARRVTRAHRANTRCSCSFMILSEMWKYFNDYKYLHCALYGMDIYNLHWVL